MESDSVFAGAFPRRIVPRRRLIKLALLILVVGPCGWLCVLAHRVHQQRQAAAVIVKLNGWYLYDYELDPPNPKDRLHPGNPSNADVPGPSALTWFVGRDYFANVVYASINAPPSSADVERLIALDKLEYLMLRYPVTQKSDLTWLGSLPNLKSVYIGWFDVTDEAVDELQRELPSNLSRINRYWMGVHLSPR